MSNAQVQACASKCRNNFWSMKKSQPNSTVSISKTANRNGLSKFNFSQNLSQKNPIFFIFFVEHAIFFCWIVCQFVTTDKEMVLGPIRTRQLLILVLYTKNASAQMSQAGVTKYRIRLIQMNLSRDQNSGRAQRRWSVYRVMHWSRIQHLRHGNAHEFNTRFLSQ